MSTTRSNKNKNIIKINEVEYEIVDGTQSDGRCFSGSIYYGLNNKISNENELNVWIQNYIIDPIFKLETADCGQFFSWVYIYNYFNYENISNNMPNDIINIFEPVPKILKNFSTGCCPGLRCSGNNSAILDITGKAP